MKRLFNNEMQLHAKTQTGHTFGCARFSYKALLFVAYRQLVPAFGQCAARKLQRQCVSTGQKTVAAVKLFGKDILVPMAESMGADDFSYLQERVPGLYVFLGCLNESKGIVHPNHSDKFRIDEDILHRGAALYAQFAHDFLADGGKA